MLQRPLKRPESVSTTADSPTAACANELMNARTSFHKLHLKVKGPGSYAAHSALNGLYDALPGHADDLVEGYQGATGRLLELPDSTPRKLNTVEEAISYINTLTSMITDLQSKMPFSEIVNDLDTIKSTLNSAKYKLTFLA